MTNKQVRSFNQKYQIAIPATIRGKRVKPIMSEQQKALKAIAEAMPVAIAIVNPANGITLYENELFRQTFGLTKESSMGREQSELYYNPTDYQKLIEEWHRESSATRREVKLKKADATPFWATVSMKSAKIYGESVIISSFADITESKLVVDAYHRQVLTFDNLYDGVLITDMQNRILDWNPAAERIFGYAKNEVMGESAEIEI